jgi:plasmid stability protein
MPSIQVKDVPEGVHAVLRRRAAAAGQSLQEYLLARLSEDAETPTIEELFERIDHHTGGRIGLDAATQAVRADRESR